MTILSGQHSCLLRHSQTGFRSIFVSRIALNTSSEWAIQWFVSSCIMAALCSGESVKRLPKLVPASSLLTTESTRKPLFAITSHRALPAPQRQRSRPCKGLPSCTQAVIKRLVHRRARSPKVLSKDGQKARAKQPSICCCDSLHSAAG